MPTRRPATDRPVTLKALGPVALLAFISAWRPPDASGRPLCESSWSSWGDFLRDFRQVRTELIARGHPKTGRPLFGDKVQAYVDAFGVEALDDATNYDLDAHWKETHADAAV